MHLTISELVTVVKRLEGQGLSPRQCRYLETFQVFMPRGRTVGGVRLYDEADVALACLIVQLRQQDVSMWIVKGILVHLGATLRDVFATKMDRAAIVEGARLLIVKRTSAPASRWTFDLRTIQQRATKAVRALRAREPEITWAGWHTIPAHRAAQLLEVTA